MRINYGKLNMILEEHGLSLANARFDDLGPSFKNYHMCVKGTNKGAIMVNETGEETWYLHTIILESENPLIIETDERRFILLNGDKYVD